MGENAQSKSVKPLVNVNVILDQFENTWNSNQRLVSGEARKLQFSVVDGK